MGAYSLYSTARWLRLRKHHLGLEPTCRMCAALGKITPGSHVDHVIPHRGDVDLFWHGELQTLCETCHNSHKQAQEKGGYLRGCDASGYPLDPAHPWRAPQSRKKV